MRALWFSLLALAACTDEGVSPPDAAPFGCSNCNNPASLTASPLSMDLGSVAVSSMSNASVVTITNSGFSESGSISAIVSGTDAAEFFVQNGCTTLAGGGTCVVSVMLKPTTAGSKTGSLVVTGSPGGTAQIVLTGVATN